MKFTRDDEGVLHETMTTKSGVLVRIIGSAESRDPVLLQVSVLERGVSVPLTPDETLKLSRLLQAATFVKRG